MKKNIIRRQINYSVNYSNLLEGKTDDIKKYIDNTVENIKKIYPEYDTIEFDYDLDSGYGGIYDNPRLSITVYGIREETDEEAKTRLATSRKQSIRDKQLAATREALKKEKDYQTYLKLQEKYKDIK